MKLENIVSHTEFVRDHQKFVEMIKKGDVVVVKNNKPSFIAVTPENYKETFERQMNAIKNYEFSMPKIQLGEIIQKIRSVKNELNKQGVTAVYVFGSYAYGAATSKSDIDILYDTKNVGFSIVQGSEILESLFDIKTQVIPAQMAKNDFVKEVKSYAIQAF